MDDSPERRNQLYRELDSHISSARKPSWKRLFRQKKDNISDEDKKEFMDTYQDTYDVPGSFISKVVGNIKSSKNMNEEEMESDLEDDMDAMDEQESQIRKQEEEISKEKTDLMWNIVGRHEKNPNEEMRLEKLDEKETELKKEEEIVIEKKNSVIRNFLDQLRFLKREEEMAEEDSGEASPRENEMLADMKDLAKISTRVMKSVPKEKMGDFKNSDDLKRFKEILKKYNLIK
ncbi:MAG: hypothetical protein ABH879_02920 [archaeon]